MDPRLPKAKVARVDLTTSPPPPDEKPLIDVLWEDPKAREELVGRVLRLERCYKSPLLVNDETSIAIVGIEFEDETDNGYVDHDHLIMPAGHLPDWFFLVVKHYAEWKYNVARPEQGLDAHGVARCGMGGLWIDVSHPNDVLDMYKTATKGVNNVHAHLLKMFEALDINPVVALNTYMANRGRELRYSEDPLICFPLKARAIINAELVRRARAELTKNFIKEWCQLMTPTHMRRLFLHAPEVTLYFDYCNWPVDE